MEFGAEEWRLGVLSLWIEEISAGILRDPPTQQVFTEQSPFSPPRGHKPTQVFSYTGGAPKPWVRWWTLAICGSLQVRGVAPSLEWPNHYLSV